MRLVLNKLILVMARSIFIIVLFLSGLGVGSAEELSAKQSQAAKKLYTAKFAKCHKFYDPNAYGQAEWDSWMQKMKKKSKMKAEQFDLVCRYLDALRGESKAGAK